MVVSQAMGSREHAPHHQTGICLHLPQILGSASPPLEVGAFGSTALSSIRMKYSSKTALLGVHTDRSHSASLITVSEGHLGPSPHPTPTPPRPALFGICTVWITKGPLPLSIQAHTFSCTLQAVPAQPPQPPMLAPNP